MMREMKRTGVELDAWTLTGTGGKVCFLRPANSDINIETVAFHTGHLCRWTGATAWFFSDAQHMAMVGTLIQIELDKQGISDKSEEYWDQILAGLFHDGGEAHTNDVSSPLKHIMGGRYGWIERGLCMELFRRYGVDWAYYNKFVRDADRLASDIERCYLLPDHADFPKKDPAQLPLKITRDSTWGPEEAGDKYLGAVKYALEKRRQARLMAPDPGGEAA